MPSPDCWVTFKVFHISEYSLGRRNEINCSKRTFQTLSFMQLRHTYLIFFGHSTAMYLLHGYLRVIFCRVDESGKWERIERPRCSLFHFIKIDSRIAYLYISSCNSDCKRLRRARNCNRRIDDTGEIRDILFRERRTSLFLNSQNSPARPSGGVDGGDDGNGFTDSSSNCGDGNCNMGMNTLKWWELVA